MPPYADGALNRRELVQRLMTHTGTLAAAMAAIEGAGLAQTSTVACPAGVQVAENDPTVTSEPLTIWGEAGPLFVYQSRPTDTTVTRRPAVVVLHENRGLNEHIRDVTRRVAKAGYVGIAVDLLSRQGGTSQFPDPEVAVAAYGRTVPAERRQDILSTLYTIQDQPYVRRDRIGAVGFCAGGGNVWDLALNTDQLAAAAAYYGQVAAVDQIPRLSAPMLCIYAELDRGLTANLGPALGALASGNKRYEVHVYNNTNHAFHNDTGARYDPTAACDAWAKTLAFFQRYLQAA